MRRVSDERVAAIVAEITHLVIQDDEHARLALDLRDERHIRQECEARSKALREALRGRAIITRHYAGPKCFVHCYVCHNRWKRDDPERHAPGCLAAPEQEDK